MATPILRDGFLTEAKAVSVGIAGCGVALASAAIFTWAVMRSNPGNAVMVHLSSMVHTAAKAFLFQQYRWLAVWVAALSIIIALVLRRAENAEAGLYTMICYVVGSLFSGLAGYIGMMIATSANARTAQACVPAELGGAPDGGMSRGLAVSFASGAVMGNAVVGLALMGLFGFYLIWTAKHPSSSRDPFFFDMVWGYIAGFGFGASSIGMFARVGGGVFTKAADVGADLVGKVENNIPEDDARNPAVIADNVGDNVGDVAGMGADLFESYAGALIACATLSPELYHIASSGRWTDMGLSDVLMAGVALPFWIYGFGVFTSLAGIVYIRAARLTEKSKLEDLLHTINAGIYLSTGLSLIMCVVAVVILFDGTLRWRLFGCIAIGLLSGVVIAQFTEYCTSYEDAPTRDISAASEYGHAPVIIKGLGVGMMSVSVPTIAMVITILACNALAGLYGVSIAAVGMLMTLSITLATDAYGPVADNAGGIAEMANLPPGVRLLTDKLDSLGNTTAATGKGLAIGSALLTAVGLIAAFLQQSGARAVDIKDPIVLTGILIGTALPFIFGALTMLSVDRSARAVITEVRLQFAQAPELMEKDASGEFVWNGEPVSKVIDGETVQRPDATRCVMIATQAAIEEMVLPGMLAVFVPVGVGFLLGPKGLGGLLAGSLGTCFMLALMMANAGGAWDNSKKWCEKSAYEGLPTPNGPTWTFFGIKTEKRFNELAATGNWAPLLRDGETAPSTPEEVDALRNSLLELYEDRHAATVTGDTVGDPFKDTSGPALNVLSKTMTMVALMLAPLYKSLGDSEGYDGFRPYGTITAAVMLVIVGGICIAAVILFGKWRTEADAKSKAAMKQAFARTASSKQSTAAAPDVKVETTVPLTSEAATA